MRYNIETYLFQSVYKLLNSDSILTIPNDSIYMSTNDTIYFRYFTKTQIAYNRNSNALFACDPVPPQINALGDSVCVIALDSFDQLHGKGSDVSDFFRILDRPFINNLETKIYYPLNSFHRFNTSDNYLHLALIQKPVNTAARFRIIVYKYDLSDGTSSDSPVLVFH